MDTEKLKALALAATKGPWQRSERLTGPFWHISSDHMIGSEPCKSGRQAIAAVHGESKRGATAYAAMFEANATFIAAANPAAVLELCNENTDLRAEVERLRAEAERYRWLRSKNNLTASGLVDHLWDEKLDAAIDAAMAKEKAAT